MKSLTDALRERLALPDELARGCDSMANYSQAEHARTEAIVSLMLAVVAALEEIEQQCNDSAVVCRKCGDEETSQDSDIAYAAREALSRLRRAADEGVKA